MATLKPQDSGHLYRPTRAKVVATLAMLGTILATAADLTVDLPEAAPKWLRWMEGAIPPASFFYGFVAACALLLLLMGIEALSERQRRGKELSSTSPATSPKMPKTSYNYWRPYIPTWEDEEFSQGRKQKHTLLRERGLNPLTDFQDGLPASEIDPGSYGFLANFGLLGSDPRQIILAREPSSDESAFEIHRLADSTIELVGFVSKQDSHAIRSGTAECKVSIFSRKTSTATELMTIPISRIISVTHNRVRRTANRLDVRLKPAA